MYKFVDLHCDTITSAANKGEGFFENNLQIDIKRLNYFLSPTQIFAIWLTREDCKNAFKKTNFFIDFFEEQLHINSKYIGKVLSFDDIKKNEDSKKISAILSIEGGESLEDDISNLEYFYNRGVRMLTLCWNYENNLGYGAFTKSTEGLKPFGKSVIKKMNELNMVIDVSHLNEKGFWDTYKISKKPFVATHSNAYSICNHFRNLKDDQIRAIRECGGIIGINFYPKFLSNDELVNEEHIFRHIDHIGNLIGFDKICLGSDFDGIEETPIGIEEVSKYYYLFDKIEKNYGKNISEKILYKNFYEFWQYNVFN